MNFGAALSPTPQPRGEPTSAIEWARQVGYRNLERREAERRDSERLDWLDKTSCCIETIGKPIEYHSGISWEEGQSMRQAIDAALDALGKEPK